MTFGPADIVSDFVALDAFYPSLLPTTGAIAAGSAIDQDLAGSDNRMGVAGDVHPLVGLGYNRLRLLQPARERLH